MLLTRLSGSVRPRSIHQTPKRTFLLEASVGAAVTGACVVTFINQRYKVSKPNEYIVKTGVGITDMHVSKTTIQWPWQRFKTITMQPLNYQFNLHAMSNQKMEFVLPGVFTIGPKDDVESLKKYARYLSDQSQATGENSVDELVRGVLEGETRVLAAQLTIEEIFNDRAKFKQNIIASVQKELDQFGLEIFNANIKELQDAVGSEYFTYLRQKTRSEAEGSARIDTSEAKKKADIGQKEREMNTRKQLAEYEASAIEKENEARKRIAESAAQLAVVSAEADKVTSIAKIEAEKQAKMREVELQREVDQRRIAQETEFLRAKNMSSAIVTAETDIKKAEGDATSIQINANATFYQKQKEADALFALKNKEAEGILKIYAAQAEGIQQLVGAFGGDRTSLIQYLMLEKDLFPQLAKANAEAIRGLSPKITIWNTGNSGENDYTKSIRNIVQSVPPLLSTIEEQTGLKPGDWLVQGFNKKSVDGDK